MQAAGLEEAGRAQRVLRDQEARSKANPVRDLVGLGDEARAQFHARGADRHAIAHLEVEPGQERVIHHASEDAVAFGEEIRDRALRLRQQFAHHRVGGVDGLELDKPRALVPGLRHRAHGGDRRDRAPLAQEGALPLAGLAMNDGERHVGAQNLSAFTGQTLGQRARDRRDAGDRRHAERDAGEEDAEPFEAAAQLARREPQEQREGSGPEGRFGSAGQATVHGEGSSRPQPPAHRPRRDRSAGAPRGRTGGRA